MAGYREHIAVSSLLGLGYGVGSTMILGFTPDQGALAACFTAVGGMLPDLDSQSGRPVREVFGFASVLAPLALMQHLFALGAHSERVLLLSVVLYVAIRYGGAALLGKLSVHRGMFHSIPALVIAAELVFLGYCSDSLAVKTLMAGGVAVGFFSHLLLDELYSVQWTGVRVRLSKSAGSALKLVGRSFLPNAFTYGLLLFLTYTSLVHSGWLDGPESAPAGTWQDHDAFPANSP